MTTSTTGGRTLLFGLPAVRAAEAQVGADGQFEKVCQQETRGEEQDLQALDFAGVGVESGDDLVGQFLRFLFGVGWALVALWAASRMGDIRRRRFLPAGTPNAINAPLACAVRPTWEMAGTPYVTRVYPRGRKKSLGRHNFT